MSSEEYTLVGVDEYEETTNESPIVYTTDIKTCIAALMHFESTSVLLHIEATKEGLHDKPYKDIIDEMPTEIKKIELFVGLQTDNNHIVSLMDYAESRGINIEVFPSKTDMYGNGSIGFNFSNHSYYGIMMENGRPVFESYNINHVRR